MHDGNIARLGRSITLDARPATSLARMGQPPTEADDRQQWEDPVDLPPTPE
jgi:hypothetical protein